MKTTANAKPRIFQVLLATVIIITAVFAVPSTNAKYTTSKKYKITIESHFRDTLEFILKGNVMSTTAGGTPSSVTYTAEKAGYYVFAAKGGDGARGMVTDSNTLSENRGIGGLVYGCVYLNQGEVLTLYAGSNATAPSRADVLPIIGTITTRHDSNPGQNAFGAGEGGNSSYTGLTRNSSGAGGAASVILKGSGNNSTLVAVAGGGGGGGGADDGRTGSQYDGVEGGEGGNGGSVTGTANSYDASNPSQTLKVFYGEAGSSAKSGNGGAAGQTSSVIAYTRPNILSAYSWKNGNGSNGSGFGGGGGGGYAGGGAGKGVSSKTDQAGGGGGGSSAVVTANANHATLKLKPELLDTVLSLNNINYSTSTESGFVVIAFIVDGDLTEIQAKYSDGNF